MARAASPDGSGAVRARAPSPDASTGSVRGRITVSARMRPLLESELARGIDLAPWALTDTTIGLRERFVGRTPDRDSEAATKTRSELRALDHLRRDDNETVMDAVFDGKATTRQVYDQSFRSIVAGTSEGLNGAILAYGQTNSGKTYSISGPKGAVSEEDTLDGMPSENRGIIHYALEDLFSQIHAKAAADPDGGSREYLVRMSYCEVYMERVNDLLRKISPQSQNLSVKEDAETKSFYVEGIKEKIVSSPVEVIELLSQAEKRRRVAHTRFNEVSSRSHTLMTLHVECSMSLEGSDSMSADDPNDVARITRVGRLTIVDLAGNEKTELGTEYIAESTSINKSLFFLGKVIESLSAHEASQKTRDEHVPFRDSKLTRLLAVHLGGNSQTGVLVTLTPHFEFIEQSMTSLRFAQKASTIRCVAKPVLISKEQSLIMKQREIISQLHHQVKELRDEQSKQPQQPASERPVTSDESKSAVSIERQHRVEELQALTLGPGTPTSQAFISKSREVDAVVAALHRNNEHLRKQKSMLVEEFKDLHKAVTEVAQETRQMVAEMQSSSSSTEVFPNCFCPPVPDTARQPKAWEPAVQELRAQLRQLLQATYNKSLALLPQNQVPPPRQSLGRVSPKQSPRKSQDTMETPSTSKHAGPDNSAAMDKLREENIRLRGSVKYLSTERERLKTEAEQARNSVLQSVSEAPCKRSDGTGPSKPGSSSSSRDLERMRSPKRDAATSLVFSTPQSPLASTRPPTSQSGARDLKDPFSTPTSNTVQDCEPIVERGFVEELRWSSGGLLSRIDKSVADCQSLFDVEPIVERGAASQCPPPPSMATKPPPPAGGSKASGSRMAPPRPPEQARPAQAGVAMDYFRQVGVRTSWRAGDTAYWRGQECRVMKVVGEDQPLYVVLQTPAGNEVTTDLCLLSEAPPSGQPSTPLRSAPTTPLRLAPLGDLCIDRPPAFDRASTQEPSLASRLAKLGGSEQSLLAAGSCPDKSGARSNSLPARGLSPVRSASRQSIGGARCESPLQS